MLSSVLSMLILEHQWAALFGQLRASCILWRVAALKKDDCQAGSGMHLCLWDEAGFVWTLTNPS